VDATGALRLVNFLLMRRRVTDRPHFYGSRRSERAGTRAEASAMV
jgi:hypothetical protein